MNDAVEIFISYAHEDQDLMDDVRLQLIGAERRGLVVKSYDRLIPPGAEWSQEVDNRLLAAQIILLLISPYFFASRYCYSMEMRIALERHEKGEAVVIPVILRPCLWQEESIGKLNPLPSDGNALELWPNRNLGTLNIAKGVMTIVRSLKKSPD